jgi:hypothetical protein
MRAIIRKGLEDWCWLAFKGLYTTGSINPYILQAQEISYYTRVREVRLIELAAYRESHGHCNVPEGYSENPLLASWVNRQRRQYRLRMDGKRSKITPARIQELENLGFEWGNSNREGWEVRLSELADYREKLGHCNVPTRCIEYKQLGKWVGTQRNQYRLRLDGKTSPMTTFRIQELESLGFEWDCSGPTWEDRLSELADYRKTHGHCNVPRNYSEDSKLAYWVGHQRTNYRLRQDGKRSQITPARIHELENLGFEWVRNPSGKKRGVLESFEHSQIAKRAKQNYQPPQRNLPQNQYPPTAQHFPAQQSCYTPPQQNPPLNQYPPTAQHFLLQQSCYPPPQRNLPQNQYQQQHQYQDQDQYHHHHQHQQYHQPHPQQYQHPPPALYQ